MVEINACRKQHGNQNHVPKCASPKLILTAVVMRLIGKRTIIKVLLTHLRSLPMVRDQ